MELKDLFKYDSENGGLVWWTKRPGVRIGMKAGFMLNGTKYVTVDGERQQVKNIVWLLKTGSMPKRTLHHINGNRSDCRFENLSFSKPKHYSRPTGTVEIQKLPFGGFEVRLDGAKVAEGDADKVLAVIKALLVY